MNHFQSLLSQALKEDIGSGDVTTKALFGRSAKTLQGRIISKQALTLAGLEIAKAAFLKVDPTLQVTLTKKDGQALKADTTVLTVTGNIRGILTAERVALNFLQHLSGIATFTRRFVEEISGIKCSILDTRKTLPGWRALAKQAVALGGGTNHRFGLHDAYLIKDNHIALFGSVSEAILKVLEQNKRGLKVEVEVDSLAQLSEALEYPVDWILLDNMPLEDLRLAVLKRNAIAGKKKPRLEASGNVNLNNVRAVAQTGVDAISIGALTHSAPAADLSLEIC